MYTVVTLGFGSFGSIHLLPTLGFRDTRTSGYLTGSLAYAPVLRGVLIANSSLVGVLCITRLQE